MGIKKNVLVSYSIYKYILYTEKRDYLKLFAK